MLESAMTIDKFGTKIWKNEDGQLHRLDGPSTEWSSGTKEWRQNGLRHRVDGPAIEAADGSKFWYQNEMRHRVDGPAVEYIDGSKQWYQNGKRHRVDGPAIEWNDGNVLWFIDGDCLGSNINGFWTLWDYLNDEQRQNVNLHMWLSKLTNV